MVGFELIEMFLQRLSPLISPDRFYVLEKIYCGTDAVNIPTQNIGTRKVQISTNKGASAALFQRRCEDAEENVLNGYLNTFNLVYSAFGSS